MHLLSANWWAKNVTPVYSLSKADTKNLASISQSIQESESTAISHIKISHSDVDRETVESNLKVIANFIRTGSAYLELQNLLSDYDAYEQIRGADLRKEVTAAEIEVDFLKQQARDLEKLRLRFPSSTSSASNQIMDLKDSGAKYLPIQTQLVAIQTDINNANERLVRLRDEQIRLEIFSSFLAQAKAAAAEQIDGLSLAENLLTANENLRMKLDLKSLNKQQALDNIHADLVSIQTRFSRGLTASQITLTSPSYVKPALLAGLSGGFLMLLMLLMLLGWRSWLRVSGQQIRV